MGRDDWYRNTTWSPADSEAFQIRLARSRSASSKAQYLRIQASCLERAGLIQSALELLEKMLEECPVESAHQQKAKCFELLGRTGEAVVEARIALATERKVPKYRSEAWLWFLVSIRVLFASRVKKTEPHSETIVQLIKIRKYDAS